jgi:hypothetical protein
MLRTRDDVYRPVASPAGQEGSSRLNSVLKIVGLLYEFTRATEAVVDKSLNLLFEILDIKMLGSGASFL